jgi:ribosomal protein S7
MPRSRFLGQREVLPDVRYRDKLVGKFINTLMSGGKKSTTERICYGAFDVIQEKTGGDPLKVFKAAVDNVKPIVEVSLAAWAGRRTRFRSRSGLRAEYPWRFVGCRNMRAPAGARACGRSSRPN